ncbi:hypothetical protein C5167_036549 [Papaver somniferum]|uniref:Uncharacterized protein n=1 Tax=Papaver somniferum TaxID=3469 RepID=A0A4Y7I7D8_PAPSO|nr:hypothetical protein C5167_036549 [Papaver somniferum]
MVPPPSTTAAFSFTPVSFLSAIKRNFQAYADENRGFWVFYKFILCYCNRSKLILPSYKSMGKASLTVGQQGHAAISTDTKWHEEEEVYFPVFVVLVLLK